MKTVLSLVLLATAAGLVSAQEERPQRPQDRPGAQDRERPRPQEPASLEEQVRRLTEQVERLTKEVERLKASMEGRPNAEGDKPGRRPPPPPPPPPPPGRRPNRE